MFGLDAWQHAAVIAVSVAVASVIGYRWLAFLEWLDERLNRAPPPRLPPRFVPDATDRGGQHVLVGARPVTSRVFHFVLGVSALTASGAFAFSVYLDYQQHALLFTLAKIAMGVLGAR